MIELLHAAARSAEPWQLKIVGRGALEHRVRRLAEQLGIDERVRMYPFIADRARLARWYAGARVVVMPGAHETFGLAAFEAVATGTPVVTCSTAPSAALMRALVQTYEPGDLDGLLAPPSRLPARRRRPRRPALPSASAARGARRSQPRRWRSSGSCGVLNGRRRSPADLRAAAVRDDATTAAG